MAYYYHPHTNSRQARLKIDNHGFRNSIPIEDGVDVVFLDD